ncbi:MAG: hypothetical protein WA655_06100 [Candidatus Korobacteraceae bacterium]
MPKGATDFRRRLLPWGAPIVIAHYLVVLWHVVLLVKVQPAFPVLAIGLLLLINLLPVAGLFTLAKGFPKSAAGMIILPFGIALVIGGYTHFLSAGSDNVLRMAPSESTLPFQLSAVVLALLEALGCWFGFKVLVSAPTP